MRGVTMTKVVGICFGLFALMAISTSAGNRQVAVKPVEKVQLPEKVQTVEKEAVKMPEETAKVNTVKTTEAVEKKTEQLPEQEKKDVHLTIAINVNKDAQVRSANVVEQPKEEVKAAKEEVKEAEVKAAKEEVKEVKVVEPKTEEKVKQPAVKAAAQPKQTKVIKPASASVLIIPMLAMVAVLVAVKVRKPGYLPEAVEEKLESMGFPAQYRSSHSAWKTPSRSMYGSV